MSNNVLISILIVNYNGLKHLEECLASIYAQSFQSFEVILVDNASQDGSIAYLEKKFPQVQIIRSPSNTGFAGGNNLGLPHCNGEFVFLLNNDTQLEADVLRNIEHAIKNHPDIQVFGCFLINYRERHLADSAGDTVYTNGIPFSFSGYPVQKFTEEKFISAACAGAAVYSQKIIKQIGFFDEDFFLLFEDLDLSFRAQHGGFKILFLPDAKVYHKGSASLGGKKSKTSLYFSERNLSLFYFKNYPTLTLLKSLPHFFCMKCLRFFNYLRLGLGITFIKANWDSLCLIPKMWPKRKAILRHSALSSKEFESLLRKNWLKERIAFKGDDFNIPL